MVLHKFSDFITYSQVPNFRVNVMFLNINDWNIDDYWLIVGYGEIRLRISIGYSYVSTAIYWSRDI
jgi:hypothetical protein